MSKTPRVRPGGKGKPRRHRSRTTPRWLTQKDSSPQQVVARARCLMMLSVLSGQLPVSDAIAQAHISRATYYKLETRALQGMLQALDPMGAAGGQTSSVSEQVSSLEARVQLLTQQRRRAERLLLLSRKSWRMPVKMTRRGRPRKSDPPMDSPTTAPGV